uniref:Sodium-coupled monocarboxylate transporter 1 n=1 Tax=Graphocephala atropunctata TaxID=36148 RepID=A0A1B6L137_9HEMI
MASTPIMSVEELGQTLQSFSVPDYIVFVLMLVVCASIGVYFGFIDKATSPEDYLVGGRKMTVFPISLSLIASYISGITLLGTPTEVYVYGMQYLYTVAGVFIMGLIMSRCYLPVFHDLKLTSSYEYLALRFDRRVRLLGSALFCISILIWLPLVIYVPALAFNQVSGINVHIVTPAVCIICIFYTCVGGIKAVVWTDAVQTFSMFGAMLLVIVKGTADVGGFHQVIQRNIDSHRIEGPEWSLDVTIRHTVWGLVIGGCVGWLQTNAVGQTMIQRYLALPTKRQAVQAVWIFVFGSTSLVVLCSYSGLLIHAKYFDCDPLTTQLAKAKDQLLPLLVMDTLGSIPGLPGLFVAGVFSAALSSMSTGLNSMAAVALEDFYKSYVNPRPSERHSNLLVRSVVVVVGVVCVLMVYIVEKLGSVLQLAISLSSIPNGPSIGIFTMGMFIPWINSTGALIGGFSSLALMSWLVVGAQYAIAHGNLKFEPKSVSSSGCDYSFNVTTKAEIINETQDIWPLLRLSYMWYTLVGAVAASCPFLL